MGMVGLHRLEHGASRTDCDPRLVGPTYVAPLMLLIYQFTQYHAQSSRNPNAI